MDKIKFSHEEENPVEIVRTLVLEMLRTEKWEQFPRSAERFNNKVEFVGNASIARNNFLVLVHEILWELIIQRVITPGSNLANPDLPFFRITDYGRKVLADGEFIPHDPSNYLEKLKEAVGTSEPVTFEYLKESLRTFNTGCYLAATMMLGIASERTFLSLCDSLLNAISSATKKKKFEKILEGVSMIAKFNFVQSEIDTLMSARKGVLPGNTRTHLLGIFDFIRVQRNDIGHPQDDLQVPERDTVYVNLRLFPQYCKTVEAVKAYLQKNKI